MHNNRRTFDSNVHSNEQFNPLNPQVEKTNKETSSKPTIRTQNNNVQEHNKIKGVCPIQKLRVKVMLLSIIYIWKVDRLIY